MMPEVELAISAVLRKVRCHFLSPRVRDWVTYSINRTGSLGFIRLESDGLRRTAPARRALSAGPLAFQPVLVGVDVKRNRIMFVKFASAAQQKNKKNQ
jgi:hypothetical protein